MSNCFSRPLHSSARRFEEQPSDATPAHPPHTRKARSAAALRQITSLKNRRIQPGALGRGSFPGGQMARRNPQSASSQADEYGFIPENGAADAQPDANARFARNSTSPTTTRGSTPPQGQMARAPSTLRITRTAVGGNDKRGPSPRGPNLRGRERGGPGGRRGGAAGNSRGDRGPKKRERAAGSDNATQSTSIYEADLKETLSDGMLQQLLRLQRKEWDRVPYEPKYAKGSFAANELIHTGRELFKGESQPVKIWGPLEKRIGVVGMFGAEAKLKIRRVGDGDEKPFGKEMEDDNMEQVMEVSGVEKEKVAAVQ